MIRLTVANEPASTDGETTETFAEILSNLHSRGFVESDPEGMTRLAVAIDEATAGGGQAFAESLSNLRSLGFLESVTDGTIRLTDQAFPLGRPGDAASGDGEVDE